MITNIFEVAVKMKKIGLSCVAIGIGCINWIIVITSLAMILFNSRAITYALGAIIGNYLIYSFVPALISTILTVRVKKGYRALNLTVNIIFLLLYTLAYFFSMRLIRYG